MNINPATKCNPSEFETVFKIFFIISFAAAATIAFITGLYINPLSDQFSDERPSPVLKTYFFQEEHIGSAKLKSEWFVAETGAWSIGKRAELALPLDDASNNDLRLSFELKPYMPQREMEVYLNGSRLAGWEIKKQDKMKEVLVPRALWNKAHPASLTFTFSNPVSPAERGINSDTRKLGVLLKAITVRKVY